MQVSAMCLASAHRGRVAHSILEFQQPPVAGPSTCVKSCEDHQYVVQPSSIIAPFYWKDQIIIN